MNRGIAFVLMRGGTSKCVCLRADAVPRERGQLDPVLLSIMGSPDPRQLNGLGGATSTTSRVCIVGPSQRDDADVDYTFAQVSVADALVDYKGNCGNCSSAVGPFAIDEGMVTYTEGETVVRIHNTNTKKLIVARVPVAGGEAAVAGDFELPGVPGRGARIALDFLEPGGAGTGRLLPTGRARDVVEGVAASLVDATNPVVFVRARDLGLSGTERPEAVDADRLFGYMLDTDKVSVIQNGVAMATRQEALEQVRSNLRGIAAVKYDWKRQHVTVLSPEVAVLAAEGQSTATTTAGQTFTTPLAQTVVFVLKDGAWRAIHAHQSAPRR